MDIKSFKLLKKLGTGAQGEVYMVEKIGGVDKGRIYAMKIFEKRKVYEDKVTTYLVKNERTVYYD